MTTRKNIPYLRLVTSENEAREHGDPWTQLPLFTDPATILGFLDTAATTGEVFSGILRAERPTWLLDLRPAPLFDLDYRFTRRVAFRLFDELQIIYHDMARLLGIEDRRDARLHAGEISRRISEFLSDSSDPGPRGPIVFLVDDDQVLETAAWVLPRTLDPKPESGWHAKILARYQGSRERRPSIL